MAGGTEEHQNRAPVAVWLTAAVVLLAVGFGLGYHWAKRSTQPLWPAAAAAPPNERALEKPDYAACLKLRDVKLRRPDFDDTLPGCKLTHCIVGLVENNCGQEFASVDLTFMLYDRSDIQIGTTRDGVSPLEAGGKARFGALVLEHRAVERFRLKELTATPQR